VRPEINDSSRGTNQNGLWNGPEHLVNGSNNS
jgi:hypothetical protein